MFFITLLLPLNSFAGKVCVGKNTGAGVSGTSCLGNVKCASAYECNFNLGGVCLPRCGDGVGKNKGHGVDYAHCSSDYDCASPYECSSYQRCIPRQKSMSKSCVGKNSGDGETGSTCSDNNDCESKLVCNKHLGGICVPRCGDSATSFPTVFRGR